MFLLELDTPTSSRSGFFKKRKVFIVFKDFQSSITSGQFAAWYIGEELIGSGVIN